MSIIICKSGTGPGIIGVRRKNAQFCEIRHGFLIIFINFDDIIEIKEIIKRRFNSMDIKETIENAVEKVTDTLKKDDSLLEKFKKSPIQIVEKIIGKDLPDDAIAKIIDLVKKKLRIGKAKDTVEGAVDGIKDAIGGLTDMFKK